MKKITKKDVWHWAIAETKSHFTTILAVFTAILLFDAKELLWAIYAMQWEVVTVDAFIALTIRTIWKTLLTMLLPKVFPYNAPQTTK